MFLKVRWLTLDCTHDLEIMSLNPGRVALELSSTSV